MILWEDDDEVALAEPEGNYLDLWVIDVGPDAIARAVLDAQTLAERDELLTIAEHAEPLLLLANGRHGLVSEEFVRNTSPDLLLAEQSGLPIALRHADIEVATAPGVPDFEHRLMVRTDRRLGFDPTREWDLIVRAAGYHAVPSVAALVSCARCGATIMQLKRAAVLLTANAFNASIACQFMTTRHNACR